MSINIGFITPELSSPIIVTDENGSPHVMCDGDGLDAPTPFCELYAGHQGPHCAGYTGSNRKNIGIRAAMPKRAVTRSK